VTKLIPLRLKQYVCRWDCPQRQPTTLMILGVLANHEVSIEYIVSAIPTEVVFVSANLQAVPHAGQEVIRSLTRRRAHQKSLPTFVRLRLRDGRKIRIYSNVQMHQSPAMGFEKVSKLTNVLGIIQSPRDANVRLASAERRHVQRLLWSSDSYIASHVGDVRTIRTIAELRRSAGRGWTAPQLINVGNDRGNDHSDGRYRCHSNLYFGICQSQDLALESMSGTRRPLWSSNFGWNFTMVSYVVYVLNRRQERIDDGALSRRVTRSGCCLSGFCGRISTPAPLPLNREIEMQSAPNWQDGGTRGVWVDSFRRMSRLQAGPPCRCAILHPFYSPSAGIRISRTPAARAATARNDQQISNRNLFG